MVFQMRKESFEQVGGGFLNLIFFLFCSKRLDGDGGGGGGVGGSSSSHLQLASSTVQVGFFTRGVLVFLSFPLGRAEKGSQQRVLSLGSTWDFCSSPSDPHGTFVLLVTDKAVGAPHAR